MTNQMSNGSKNLGYEIQTYESGRSVKKRGNGGRKSTNKSPNKTLSKIEQDNEWNKCKKNPIYFIMTYCIISHPTRGNVPFKLFKYQRGLIKKFFDKAYRLHQIVKSRQLGVSTVYSALLL